MRQAASGGAQAGGRRRRARQQVPGGQTGRARGARRRQLRRLVASRVNVGGTTGLETSIAWPAGRWQGSARWAPGTRPLANVNLGSNNQGILVHFSTKF